MIRTMSCLVVLLPTLLVAQGGDEGLRRPGVWNQWRGPFRTGRYDATPWPARLNEGNFVRAWRVELGPSYSGPVVDADRVYTTETVDKKREVVTAFDRVTGKKVWQQSWDGAMKVPFFAARNGSWIRSTPTLDGDSLFVAGMRDVLVCLDAKTGKERWRVDFVERFKTPLPEFGFVCSPLVHGDHVYVQAGAAFVKLEKATGKTVWRSLADAGGMWGSAFSSPIVATLRGKEQLVVQTRTHLHGVDPADGTSLWDTKVRAFRGMNILTPTAYGESIFTSAYGGRGHLFGVTRDDDAFAVAETWSSRAQGNMTTCVIVGAHAYLLLRSKRFVCVDLGTGELAWISDPTGDTYWSLVTQGDRILALSDGGELHHIRATPAKLDLVDTIRVSEGQTWAHLAVDGDQVFVRELDGLSAFTWKDGAGAAASGK